MLREWLKGNGIPKHCYSMSTTAILISDSHLSQRIGHDDPLIDLFEVQKKRLENLGPRTYALDDREQFQAIAAINLHGGYAPAGLSARMLYQ